MINTFKIHPRIQETLFLGFVTLICFGLSVFRYSYTGSKVFLFLNWNLFLACVPWLLTSFVAITPKIGKSKIILAILFFVWLVFFPNAPYILTDLFHLRLKTSMPVWFDLFLILCFAWAGLLFGFLSLWDIEQLLKNQTKNKVSSFWITATTIFFLFLSGFGIYIGRYLRWNTWDIINQPSALFNDITLRFTNLTEYPRMVGMTILMGIFLNILYFSFRFIRERKNF
ncbi:DUF1361 domain-containing protein [Bernardetia sp. MNP-M8]|uniref:DUF1361 domain-containing protein n=1 Tax=Bernardetia sp. MNP-M8 TaxID=3127470 RepID=UPI0030CC13B0